MGELVVRPLHHEVLAFLMVGKEFVLRFLGRLIFFTGFTLTKFSQQLMGIQPGIMSVVPEKLDGVQSDRLNIFRANRIGDHSGFDFFFAAPLIDTVGAGTTFPQHFNAINRLVPIGPGDAQRGGVDLL
jgi:hypothetical protein